MGDKWHKGCGGKVIHQKPMYPASFKKAGYCLSCEKFPLTEEEIIYKVKDGFEILFGKAWIILSEEQIKEIQNIDLS